MQQQTTCRIRTLSRLPGNLWNRCLQRARICDFGIGIPNPACWATSTPDAGPVPVPGPALNRGLAIMSWSCLNGHQTPSRESSPKLYRYLLCTFKNVLDDILWDASRASRRLCSLLEHTLHAVPLVR